MVVALSLKQKFNQRRLSLLNPSFNKSTKEAHYLAFDGLDIEAQTF